MSRWTALALLVMVCGLGVGLRVADLRADGPTFFPNGLTESAPVKDEAAKCLAPRNRVLFGAWSPSPLDDYRFWETLSPVWTGSLYLWFAACGPGYSQARMFSVFWSLVSMVALFFILSGRSLRAGLLAAVFFAANFYLVSFGRLGLLETMLNALLILSFLCLVRAGKRPGLVYAAAGLWLAAWFVKQNAVVFLPVIFFAGLLGADRRGRRAALITGSVVLLVAAACLLWPDYRIRSIMNLRHALDYRPDPTYLWMRIDPARTLAALARNLTTGFTRGFMSMSPLSGLPALAALIELAIPKRRPGYGRVGMLAAIWWLSAFIVLSFQGQLAPRFHLILLPATLLLSAMTLDRLADTAGKIGGRVRPTTVMAAVVGAVVVLDLSTWSSFSGSSHEIEKGERKLMEIIGDRPATLSGEWAGPLAFDTPYKYFYLKNVFNRTAEQTAGLGITHLLIQAGEEDGEDIDPAARRMRKYFPAAWSARKAVGSIRLGEQTEVIVYELPPQPWAEGSAAIEDEGTR